MRLNNDIEKPLLAKFVRNFCYIGYLVIALSSCDKVVNDSQMIPTPSIPQATTEVMKQLYPNVSSFVFKPLEESKTWQSNFSSASGKVTSLIDYQGEIVDLNELVGVSKSLPPSIKQHLTAKYPAAQIIKFYDIVKSTPQSTGYKLTIQNSGGTSINLYYDTSFNFVKEEVIFPSNILSVSFSSTEVITYDNSIPSIVRQFFTNNQLNSASIILYKLNSGNFQLLLSFRTLVEGNAQAAEIILSSTGEILQWCSAIENEVSYNTLSKNSLPTDASNYIKNYLTSASVDYAASEQYFGKNKTHYIAVKKGDKELYLLVDEEGIQDNVAIVRMAALTVNDLPNSFKTELNALFTTWTINTIRAVYEPYYQKDSNPTTDKIKHYQLEVKQGTSNYAVRFDKDGNLLFRYKL